MFYRQARQGWDNNKASGEYSFNFLIAAAKTK